MWSRREPDGLWLLCLESGEWLRKSLEAFCLERSLRGAQVSGIGGLREVELGYWRGGDYQRQTLPGDWELVSLQGNITLYQGQPFAHLHASLAGPDLSIRGGHFFEGRVTATAELFVNPCRPVVREWDESVGAGLWRPDQE